MVAARSYTMRDLQRQKRVDFETSESGEMTPRHTVGQALELFRGRMQINAESRLTAFSRGRLLDSKLALNDIEETDLEWTVVPEVSAGRV